MESGKKSIEGLILQINQPPFGGIVLPVRLIPPAKRVEQRDDDDPNDIHPWQAETELAQPAGSESAGRENVLTRLASLIDEQERGERMNHIEMNDIEEEGDSAKDDHRFGKPTLQWLDQRQKDQSGAHRHKQKMQGRWIFRCVQERS